MSSKPAEEAAEIPVAEVVQEKDPEDLDAGVVEDLYTKYSEAALFQLGGDSNQREKFLGRP